MTLFAALAVIALRNPVMWVVVVVCIAVLGFGWQFGFRPALAIVTAPYRRRGHHHRRPR